MRSVRRKTRSAPPARARNGPARSSQSAAAAPLETAATVNVGAGLDLPDDAARSKVLHLQRTIGNQAVLGYLGKDGAGGGGGPASDTSRIERAAGRAGSSLFVVQRHSAFEHYLLGQVAPDDLANLPFIREAAAARKEAEKSAERQAMLEGALSGLAMGGAALGMGSVAVASPPASPPLPAIDQTKLNQARHTIEQEMARLEAFIKDPEAIPGRGDQKTGQVKKVDGKWQIPYVEIPVRGGEKVVVAYSEINTMPDLFGNPEAIAQTPKDKVLALLQGIRQQTYIKLDQMYVEIFGESRYKLGRTYAFGTDFQGATGPRGQAVNAWAYEKRTESQVNAATKRPGEESEQYFAALERNACHFAPASWEAWKDYHQKALDKAKESATEREQAQRDPSKKDEHEAEASKLANEALLLNAFGEHYLQDSFAAGHLIDKTKIMQWFVQYLDRTGVELGSFARAKAEWAMVKTVANAGDLKSNPQALQDKIVRGEIGSFDEATKAIGMKVKPEITFMMRWREKASQQGQFKNLTPEDAAREVWTIDSPERIRGWLEALVQQGFAELKTEGWIERRQVYSLDQAQIDVVQNQGAYQARTKDSDYFTQAAEFNVAAYNAFLSNAYVQAATKFFHDKYCVEGLEVKAGNGDSLGRIYGDENMLKAGAQQGVKYSAETSKFSREAVFSVINGEREEHSTDEIADRFPKTVIDNGMELPIADWWNALKQSGDEGNFVKAKSGAARAGYKVMGGGGISGGHALALEKVPHEPF